MQFFTGTFEKVIMQHIIISFKFNMFSSNLKFYLVFFRHFHSEGDSSDIRFSLHQEDMHWFKPWKFSLAKLNLMTLSSHVYFSTYCFWLLSDVSWKYDHDLHQWKDICHIYKQYDRMSKKLISIKGRQNF